MSKAFQSQDCSLGETSRNQNTSFSCGLAFSLALQFLRDLLRLQHIHDSTRNPLPFLPSSRARDAQESWRCCGLTVVKGHQVQSIHVISRASQQMGEKSAELSEWSRPQDLSEQGPQGGQSCHCCSEEQEAGWWLVKICGIYGDKPPGASQQKLSFSEKSSSESFSQWGEEEHQTPLGCLWVVKG